MTEKSVLARLKDYEKVAEQFAQFFNQEELGALIDRKADMEIVRRLHDSKAENTELEGVRRGLPDIEKKLKHIAVL